MLADLRSGDEIAKAADRLLRSASAYGRFPTPVNDLVEAADLGVEPDAPPSGALEIAIRFLSADFLRKSGPAPQ